MDGKLLILCDEMPGEYEHYTVRDRNYLVAPMRNTEEDTDRIFVAWDSIIPEDRSFIEACKYYARLQEKPAPDFALKQKGSSDSRWGSIKGSLQEESFLTEYSNMINYLSRLNAQEKDWQGEAMELSVQYQFDAMQRFYEDFSRIMNLNGVVRIMPCFSRNSEPNITAYRKQVLDCWQNANKFMRGNSSAAIVNDPMVYSNMGEVYSKSTTELLNIMSMPYFFEQDAKKDLPGEEEKGGLEK